MRRLPRSKCLGRIRSECDVNHQIMKAVFPAGKNGNFLLTFLPYPAETGGKAAGKLHFRLGNTFLKNAGFDSFSERPLTEHPVWDSTFVKIACPSLSILVFMEMMSTVIHQPFRLKTEYTLPFNSIPQHGLCSSIATVFCWEVGRPPRNLKRWTAAFELALFRVWWQTTTRIRYTVFRNHLKE